MLYHPVHLHMHEIVCMYCILYVSEYNSQRIISIVLFNLQTQQSFLQFCIITCVNCKFDGCVWQHILSVWGYVHCKQHTLVRMYKIPSVITCFATTTFNFLHRFLQAYLHLYRNWYICMCTENVLHIYSE